MGIEIFFDLEFTIELIVAELLFLATTRRRQHFAVRGIVMCSICFLLSYIFSYQNWDLYVPLGGASIMFRFIGMFFLTMIGIYFCYDCSLYKVILSGIGGYILQHMAFAGHELFKTIGQIKETDFINIFSLLIIYSIVYFLVYKILIRQINKEEAPIEMWNILLLSTYILVIVIVLSVFSHGLGKTETIICRMFSIMSCIMGFSILGELLKNRKLERDLDIIQQMVMMKADYYELLKENIATTNMKCHDFKHQIAQMRISGGALSNMTDEAVKDLEDSINIYDAISKTGNDALDIVLTEKSLYCEKEKIHFTYMVDGEKLHIMRDKDIYTLFGNALDNAIEAVMRLEDSQKRVINFTATGNGEFLKILIHNYYEEDLKIVNGLPQTTKKDKSYHGYGMKSIKMLVEKYHGDMLFSFDENIFNLNIVIPTTEW